MFDFESAKQGLAQGTGLIQQYLMDKYMRGVEMQDWTKKQDYIGRQEVAREERAEGRYQKHFEQNLKAEDELAQQREIRQATMALYDMNPEYQTFVKRATSKDATLQEQMALLGLQKIRKKQSSFEPLEEEEMNFLGGLPVSFQNYFLTQEQENEKFRRNEQMQKEYYESMSDYREDIARGRDVSEERTRQLIEGTEEDRTRERIEDVDQLMKDLHQAEKDYANFQKDEMFMGLRMRDRQGKLSPDLQSELDRYLEVENTMKGHISYLRERADQAKEQARQKKEELTRSKGSGGAYGHAELRGKDLIKDSPTSGGASAQVDLKKDIGKKPPPDKSIPPIPEKVLAKVKELNPELTDETIQRIWELAGGQLTEEERKFLGLDKEEKPRQYYQGR